MSNKIKKKDLRRKFFELRRSLSDKDHHEKSKSLSSHLIKHLNELKSQSVFCYFPFKGEPNIKDVLLAHYDQYSLALPVVEPQLEEMDFLPWLKEEELHLNQYGIPQPQKGKDAVALSPDENTIILIPALAIDQMGYRLGYGGGYYDRYLFTYPMSIKVGIIFEDFLVDELPRDQWDMALDFIITDRDIYKIS